VFVISWNDPFEWQPSSNQQNIVFDAPLVMAMPVNPCGWAKETEPGSAPFASGNLTIFNNGISCGPMMH